MKKSSKKDFDLKVDYAKLPKEVTEVVETEPEVISEDAKISFDGRQYVVRFPKEIAETMSVSTDDIIRFTLRRIKTKDKDEKDFKIELIKK